MPGNVLLQYNDYGLGSPGHRDYIRHRQTYIYIYIHTVSRESFSFSFSESDHIYVFYAYRCIVEAYSRITDTARVRLNNATIIIIIHTRSSIYRYVYRCLYIIPERCNNNEIYIILISRRGEKGYIIIL